MDSYKNVGWYVAPFMVTEGYTTDALSGLKPSDFVVEYRGDEDAN